MDLDLKLCLYVKNCQARDVAVQKEKIIMYTFPTVFFWNKCLFVCLFIIQRIGRYTGSRKFGYFAVNVNVSMFLFWFILSDLSQILGGIVLMNFRLLQRRNNQFRYLNSPFKAKLCIM